ncbi:hypothetical protein ACH5RR_022576 [Cinchona calisaya]|uniref:MORF/ORRM1/DAG-like MORF domain-containing protein n=1 Tax=Cinchona calisaya TaxID=153742 RepID=A0ABD2Z9A4_9GENT
MALNSLRLRRALSLSSSLLHQHFHSPKLISPLHSISSSTTLSPQNPRTTAPFSPEFHSFRHFRSSPISLSTRNRRFESDDQMEITPDTILFEGCDYNHWLITVDFPKGNNLSAEEKVQKYVDIAAGVFGSEEEAKKKIYACSTTTYEGFQVECSEETSEKFKENPAVVFVLPDSYIDPVNKQYGGDKYDNGTIYYRPPPMMYRNPRRPQGPPPPRQGPPPPRQESWRPMPGEQRNFAPQQNSGPQQNHPTHQNFGPQQNHLAQQNFAPPRGSVSQQNYGLPQNAPPQQTYGQQQNAPPRDNYGMQDNATAQQNYGYSSPQHNYGQSQNHPNQQNYGPPQNFTPQQNYGSPRMHSPIQQNYGQPGGIEGRGPTTAPGGWDQHHSGIGDFPQREERYTSADSGNFAGQSYTSSQGGTFHQGLGGAPGQEMGPAYGQNHPMHGEDQKFSEVDQRSRFQGGEQRNFA